MFADNPFIPATNFLPSLLMQIYVALMVVAMAVATVFDLYHTRSARFFAQQRTRSRAAARVKLSGPMLNRGWDSSAGCRSTPGRQGKWQSPGGAPCSGTPQGGASC